MNSQTSSYSSLLDYLEDEKKSTAEFKKQATKPKPAVDFSKKAKQQTKEDTQKLIKESIEGIHSDVLPGYNKSSVGFNVNKFESLMRSKLIEDHKKMQSYDRPYISVTELFSCLRQKYYIRMKYQVNVEKMYGFSYLYLINRVGDTVHDIIQNLYDHTEVEKTIISERFKVKGRIDGIRNNCLLEYKTIDASKFKDEYLENHYLQALIYAHILNNEYSYKIDTITIVYIIRDLKRIVPFDLPIDDKKAEVYLNRSQILLKAIEDKKVPDTIGSDAEQCKYCEYKKYCKQDSGGKPVSHTNKKDTSTKPVFLM